MLAALQAAEDATERQARKNTIARGHDLLDHLEDLQRGLLMGDYGPEQLQNLARYVQNQRESVDDPRLNAIIDDIEMRVLIELAKFGL
jgi:hypothetical protein